MVAVLPQKHCWIPLERNVYSAAALVGCAVRALEWPLFKGQCNRFTTVGVGNTSPVSPFKCYLVLAGLHADLPIKHLSV